jgi:hypothetical protein
MTTADGRVSAEDVPGKETLSQFVAKVLDQLSLSAWLPSAVLVGAFAYLAQVRETGGSATEALGEVAGASIPQLVLALGAVIVGTVATQAFEFEAIRVLEGYWGTRLLPARLADLGCRAQIWRRARLEKQRMDARAAAVATARRPMLEKFDVGVVNAIEASVLRIPISVPDKDAEIADSVPWKQYADPALVRQSEDLATRLRSLPARKHRMLPTTLGNTLRAHEDRATELTGEDVEGLVLRRFHTVPAALQHEHDQYRTRLDLYCSMVFIAVLIGGLGVVMLWKFGLPQVAVVAAVGLASAWIFQRAAISAARGYGLVLEIIADVQTTPSAASATSSSSSETP